MSDENKLKTFRRKMLILRWLFQFKHTRTHTPVETYLNKHGLKANTDQVINKLWLSLFKRDGRAVFLVKPTGFYVRMQSALCAALSVFVYYCVVAVFTCMGSHMSAQVAGLTETLPALMAEILSLAHERPQHPWSHTGKRNTQLNRIRSNPTQYRSSSPSFNWVITATVSKCSC